MSGLRPIGSEKLQGEDKIKRIMEIARYGEVEKNTTYHSSTNSFSKKAADGVTYAIIHEKDGYYVKSGLNESELDYVDGLNNKRKNRFRSYSSALKRINLILKPINEQYNGGRGDSLYEQSEDEGEEKFVLKVDAPVDDMGGDEDLEMGDEEMDMEDDEMDMEDDEMGMEDDMGDDEEMDTEIEIDTDIPSMKSIQKITGKLGQKLRDAEEELDSESIKYVLNSVISAVNLENLDDEDIEDVLDRFDIEEDEEYGMDDEFEVEDDEFGDEDMEIGDEDMEMGDEDMEIEDEEVTLSEQKRFISEQFGFGFLKMIKLMKRAIDRVLEGDYALSAAELKTLGILIKLGATVLAPLGVSGALFKTWKTIYKNKGKSAKGWKKIGKGAAEALKNIKEQRAPISKGSLMEQKAWRKILSFVPLKKFKLVMMKIHEGKKVNPDAIKQLRKILLMTTLFPAPFIRAVRAALATYEKSQKESETVKESLMEQKAWRKILKPSEEKNMWKKIHDAVAKIYEGKKVSPDVISAMKSILTMTLLFPAPFLSVVRGALTAYAKAQKEPETVKESLGDKVNRTLKKYFKETKNEKVIKEQKAKKFLKGKIHETSSVNKIKKFTHNIEQEISATKLIKENKNINFLGSTKKGTLVFGNDNNRIGVTKRGNFIK